jgi:hypothetical protein
MLLFKKVSGQRVEDDGQENSANPAKRGLPSDDVKRPII